MNSHPNIFNVACGFTQSSTTKIFLLMKLLILVQLTEICLPIISIVLYKAQKGHNH